MNKFKIGDIVFAIYGKHPLVGTVVHFDEKEQKYLVRFSAVQQLYYAENELTHYYNDK